MRTPTLEGQVAELVDDQGGAGEQHRVAGLGLGATEPNGEMRFADTGWPEVISPSTEVDLACG